MELTRLKLRDDAWEANSVIIISTTNAFSTWVGKKEREGQNQTQKYPQLKISKTSVATVNQNCKLTFPLKPI